MVKRKTKNNNKEVDGYYYDGKNSTTLYKVKDGSVVHEANTNTNTIKLTVNHLSSQSRIDFLKEQADKLQLIVDNLRKMGGI